MSAPSEPMTLPRTPRPDSAGRRTAALAAVCGATATAGLIVVDAFLLQPGAGLPSPVSRGVIPMVVLLGLIMAFRQLLLSRFNAVTAEVVQALFVLVFASWVVLTAVGVWFRGPGMALVWPWGGGG